ncbi:16S rRNA (uracil(1498)-N(3))-methyltransferase [Candidatus Saganbacteria bacterium]|nr:16S rRNA (uracil(1498)-N(3))-methyltransferase [Candidatus Saganbacteria bacterium]
MNRFYVPSDQIKGDEVSITGSDVNHIKNVLRLKAGDKIEVFDGSQKSYLCELQEFNREFIRGMIISETKKDIEPTIKVTLAQCLLKGKKMDLVIQKAVELGVDRVIPVTSERSVPDIKEKEDKKLSHWRTIAKEAAEQCGRTLVPDISSLLSFEELLKLGKTFDLALVPWELETGNSLKQALKEPRRLAAGPASFLVTIGPEGGFSNEEIAKAGSAGFKAVSLGRRILRAETAAISTLANIYFFLD